MQTGFNLDDFENSLLSFNQVNSENIVAALSERGVQPLDIVEKLIVPAMNRIGCAWSDGNNSLSQVYMSGRICENIINDLLPSSVTGKIESPVIALAVYDDYHMLGAKVLRSFLRSAGLRVIYYGRCSAEELLEKTFEDKIEILLISTLMLNSAIKLKDLISRLRQKNPDIKIITGGSPFIFDPDLCREVGADSTCSSVSKVVDMIKNIKEGRDIDE